MGAEHQPISYVDLFSKSPSPATPFANLGSPSRELVPLTPISPPDACENEGPAQDETPEPTLFSVLTSGLSLRDLTPRQMAEVSLDLYAAGADRPRDYVTQWEDRLNFERRYNPQNTRLVRKTEHIVSLLLTLDGPPDGSGRPMAA